MIQQPIGLVVCGGKSSRMGKDKCNLEYHGVPQWEYVRHQLQSLCKEVLISCREEQTELFPEDAPLLTDEYEDIGPMAALLSAFKKYPESSILAVGCDYPQLHVNDLEALLQLTDPECDAGVYWHADSGIIEPLIAVYQPSIYPLLQEAAGQGMFGLQQVLREANCHLIAVEHPERLRSFDTEEDVKEWLGNGSRVVGE